MPDFDTPR
jgi:chromosome segregation ATPase